MTYLINLIKIRLKDSIRFIYSKLPMYIKCGRKYCKIYNTTYSFLKKSEYWTENQLKNYQNKELQKIILYAYENVPYYKELFDSHHINPNTILKIEDLEKIPYLTKEIIKIQGDKLLSKKYNKKDIVLHETGGSSGKPSKFYFDKFEEARESAYVNFIYERIGCCIAKDRVVSFADSQFLREEQTLHKDIYYKKYPGKNVWCFNYLNINLSTYEAMLKTLERINPDWIITFPSCIYQLCKCIIKGGKKYKLSALKGIIFKSETLYPFQLETIKKVFDVKFLHIYGHTEHACIAGTCEYGLNFHIQPQYGIAEFIESDNEKKELVATGLQNYVMPLIRYKTEDLFILKSKVCSCGRHYQNIDSIEGRAIDYLYMKNGKKVSDIFCDFATGGKSSWLDKCIRFRILQSEIGKCTIEYIPVDSNIDFISLEKEIKSTCEKYFFNEMEVQPKMVNEIPKTSRGKDKFIVSNIKDV